LVRPWACSSTAITRRWRANHGRILPYVDSIVEPPPCRSTSGAPPAAPWTSWYIWMPLTDRCPRVTGEGESVSVVMLGSSGGRDRDALAARAQTAAQNVQCTGFMSSSSAKGTRPETERGRGSRGSGAARTERAVGPARQVELAAQLGDDLGRVVVIAQPRDPVSVGG